MTELIPTTPNNVFEQLFDTNSNACTLDFLVKSLLQNLNVFLSKHRKRLDSYWIDICSLNNPTLEAQWNASYCDCEYGYKLFETCNGSVTKEIFESLLDMERNFGYFAPLLRKPKFNFPTSATGKILIFVAITKKR